MFLVSEIIKNRHAGTFASMLMNSSGLLHEAARGPFLYARISLACFEAEKAFFLSILRLSKKYTILIKKRVYFEMA